jgi:heterodisulfide reductase subunit B
MTRYAYFPGCSLHATAREYDESLRAVAGMLDIQLSEIEDWCCCGATPAHALDPRSAHLLGVWNLAKAGGSTDPVLTGCASCFSRLRAVRHEIEKDPVAAREDAGRMGVSLAMDQKILHIAQILASAGMKNRLEAAVTRPLAGLRVACYYGCLLTRPRGDDAVDDAENPRILEDLVRAVGAEPVDWPLRLDCCGASMALPRADLVQELSGKLLVMAHERGAQVMMVACPLCHSNLDFQQAAALRRAGAAFRMPVLYLTQLLGLAMQIAPGRLGLHRHFVPVDAERLLSASMEGARHV